MNLPQTKNLLNSAAIKVSQLVLRNYRWQPTMDARVRRKPHQRWPNYPKKWPGGQEHYKFTYYPRYPDQEDPDWEPSPLFLIMRRKPYSGQPYWEKQLLKEFRIEQPTCYTNIVLNDELTNAKLWKIKHLISITPITFPDGYPEEKDIGRCRLFENGEFRIQANLGVNDAQLEATEKYQGKANSIDKHMIENHLRKNWNSAYQNLLKDV